MDGGEERRLRFSPWQPALKSFDPRSGRKVFPHQTLCDGRTGGAALDPLTRSYIKCENLLRGCCFRLGDDRAECGVVVDRELAEHFAIDLDSAAVQSMDELRILDVVLSARGGDSRDPKSTEFALLCAAIAERILSRLHHLLMRVMENVFLTAPISGGLIDDLL